MAVDVDERVVVAPPQGMAGAAPVLHHHGDLVVGLQVQLLGLVQDLGEGDTKKGRERGG